MLFDHRGECKAKIRRTNFREGPYPSNEVFKDYDGLKKLNRLKTSWFLNSLKL